MTDRKAIRSARAPRAAKAERRGRASQGEDLTLDQTIEAARRGRVNVTPEHAVQIAGKLYSEGKFRQAERVCRQLIASRPGNADAHNILGAVLQALGRGTEALAELRIAVKLAPDAANLRANFGEVLRRNGMLDEASAELASAITLDPDNAQALNNAGIIHFERREYAKAASLYRRAIEVRPTMAEAFNNLANALRLSGDAEGAIGAYTDALTHREIYPEAYNNLGLLLQQDRRIEEAEHALRKAIAQNPRYIDAHNNLASLLSAEKKDVEALRVLAEALKIAPRDGQTLVITARIQARRGSLQAAEQAARMAIEEQPANAEALAILGQVLHETDRYEDALEALHKAVEADPLNAEAHNFLGVALKSVGRLDEARDHLLRALALNDGMFGAYANLGDLVDFSEGRGDELFGRMDAIFQSVSNPEAPPFLPLHFAYAKALDDRGEHDRALRHYITGGRMKRAQLDYDEAETFAFFDAIREAFPAGIFKDRPHPGLDDERPVFIIGMPRSGSTLVEQILASHPGVHGAGEVKYLSRAIGEIRDRFPSLPRYPQMMGRITPAQLEILARKYLDALCAGSGNSRRITDKLLTNYFFVGLIHLLYPKAKFVNTLRDPVDTCLSGFTKLFKDDMPHSYDLAELGRYYCKYEELMGHWRTVLPKGVLATVQYEDVVADTEKAARALLEFIGLEWDARCLDFYKSDRPVKTASVAQVRKPIYQTAVRRWMKYGPELQPLVEELTGAVRQERAPGQSGNSAAARTGGTAR